MPEPLPHGLRIDSEPGRITVSIDDVSRDLSPAEAERLLTGLHYAIGRGTPGIGIGSMFLNGSLWGAKFTERDRQEAIRAMRQLIDDLERKLDSMLSDAEGQAQG